MEVKPHPGAAPQLSMGPKAGSTLSTEPHAIRRPVGAAPILGEPSAHSLPTRVSTRQPKMIAVGGGKGGIGKSLISSNLALHLAALGQRVILLDADLGGANLHTCLGMRMPATTLSDFISRRVEALQEIITPTGFANLSLISGALDVFNAANPKYSEKMRLMSHLAGLDTDCIIIDLGAGTGFHTLDFFLLAQYGILATLPEPTSIENVYRFIKAVSYRRLQALQIELNLGAVVQDALRERPHGGLRSPAAILAQVARVSPDAARHLGKELDASDWSLIINQARTPEEYLLGRSISDACRKYLGVKMRYLGAIPYDDAVWQAVRKRRPLIVESPQSAAAHHIRDIVHNLGLKD